MNVLPYVKDLVLVGGGHSHALVLRKWGMNPLAGARLTLIDPGPMAAYSGMLPGFVAGHYRRDELDIDLVKLARFAGARFITGYATAIDAKAKRITVPGRPAISYDVCSIDVGITSEMPMLKGFAEHAVPAKPLAAFASKWDAYRSSATAPKVVVIGGGVAGAELSLAMSYALRALGKTPTIHLIDRSSALTTLGSRSRNRVLAALKELGVSLREGSQVNEVTADGVVLADGSSIAADFVVGAAGAKPHDWQADIGVDLHEGYIAVDANLQSSDPAIFAVGDCAHLSASPRPKAGVFAVREAPILFENLRAALSAKPLRAYQPQKDYLKLISLGGKAALADKFGFALSGSLMWRWKDRIDRAFMDQFDPLPVMKQPDLPQDHVEGLREAVGQKPMCGGCGAKVGSGALSSALEELGPPRREDVVRPKGDDAGLIQFENTTQVISTDHLRAFTNDPVVMTRIAAIHALGDIWAMGAAPQAATINLVLPRLSEELQSRTLSEIIKTAEATLKEAGAEIVGGHTSVGDELTIGFTLTGIVRSQPVTLAGANVGDVLILTKPIGSGVLMAGEMQGQAKGTDVVAGLERMMQSQATASEILTGAHAMTDVTGFGLAGHLWNICVASGVGAEVQLDDVPCLPGVVALAEAGIQSTLYPSNIANVPYEGPKSPLLDLMFDPQTAGGLLAAIAAKDHERLLRDLRSKGFEAKRIGRITKGQTLRFI